ncbi:MAG: Gfo/Idh/MocA family oxidoreductase [Planctomycetes bacterium]|nr:Gfo/Idh/MocA family oxidoreductase [Planctomycetota bacterium]
MTTKSVPPPVSVALVGIGGYGETYLRGLLDDQKSHLVAMVAAIDPAPDRCSRLSDVQRRGIPVFPDLATYFKAGGGADLVVIASPIHLHAEQTCVALAHGSHVLCEKPLCSTVQDGERMMAAHRASGRHAAIGYQWSFSDAITALKRDIMSGRFGRPTLLKTKVLWPRTHSYYGRSPWAGAMKAKNGAWVLDSPVNNATAHYLHNALFCLGAERDSSATPESVIAELYRANDITNFDTAVLRIHLSNGADLLYVASHAADPVTETVLSYRFERAVVGYRQGDPAITAVCTDGTRIDYAPAEVPDDLEKLWAMVAAIRGGASPACPPSAALAQTLCVNGAQRSMPEITVFPKDMVRTDGDGDARRCIVPGLHEALTRCYLEGRLPSELGFPWARPGRMVDVRSLNVF